MQRFAWPKQPEKIFLYADVCKKNTSISEGDFHCLYEGFDMMHFLGRFYKVAKEENGTLDMKYF